MDSKQTMQAMQQQLNMLQKYCTSFQEQLEILTKSSSNNAASTSTSTNNASSISTNNAPSTLTNNTASTSTNNTTSTYNNAASTSTNNAADSTDNLPPAILDIDPTDKTTPGASNNYQPQSSTVATNKTTPDGSSNIQLQSSPPAFIAAAKKGSNAKVFAEQPGTILRKATKKRYFREAGKHKEFINISLIEALVSAELLNINWNAKKFQCLISTDCEYAKIKDASSPSAVLSHYYRKKKDHGTWTESKKKELESKYGHYTEQMMAFVVKRYQQYIDGKIDVTFEDIIQAAEHNNLAKMDIYKAPPMPQSIDTNLLSIEDALDADVFRAEGVSDDGADVADANVLRTNDERIDSDANDQLAKDANAEILRIRQEYQQKFKEQEAELQKLRQSQLFLSIASNESKAERKKKKKNKKIRKKPKQVLSRLRKRHQKELSISEHKHVLDLRCIGDEVACDMCNADIKEDTKRYRCGVGCDYDICLFCAEQ